MEDLSPLSPHMRNLTKRRPCCVSAP